MNLHSFVGVDPASGDFECAFIRNGERDVIHKTFTIKVTELDQMVQWIRNEHVDVAAIEGSGGYTRPLEHALRQAEISFYSIDPYRITRYRQAVLGQHKNNQKDAIAVAHFAREQAIEGDPIGAHGFLTRRSALWCGYTNKNSGRRPAKSTGSGNVFRISQVICFWH